MKIIDRIRQANDIANYLTDHIFPYWKGMLLILVSFWILLKIMDLLLAWASYRSVTATVSHKERVYYPNWRKSYYLIYTDQGVFRNSDNWAFLNFNSSNTYSEIQVGSTYKFSVYGYRSTFFSEYPNVVKVVKV